MKDIPGMIFDTDGFAVHDGPGIRMCVYLKGCPLSCAWCHSPESQKSAPELVFIRERCSNCGTCADTCPVNVHDLSGDRHKLNREDCRACGACSETCLSNALKIKGIRVTVETLRRKIRRMKPFFDRSGGGVTITGGEPGMQPGFTEELLRLCRKIKVHTAIETSGISGPKAMSPLLRLADLVLFDLKLADADAHRKWTGQDNGKIIETLDILEPGKAVIRIPLVPGITDTEKNLCGIFRLMKERSLDRADLLPYNTSAPAKYEWLDREYPLKAQATQGMDRQSISSLAETSGINILPP